MPLAELPSKLEVPLIIISSCSYFTFAVLITVYHLFNVRKYIGIKAFQCEYLMQNPTTLLSYLLLISGIMFGLNSVLGVAIGLHSDIFCNIQKHTGPICYISFKTILYLTLIARTWQVFNNSVLEYNTKKLLIWSFFLILWSITTLCFNSFGVILEINNKYPRCLIYVQLDFLASSMLCDVISGGIGIYLFIHPLYKLSKIADCDIDIKNMAKKQTILASIAIFSTVFTLALIALFRAPKFFSSLDAVISTLSIIYMHKWHSDFIDKIFFCCLVQKSKLKSVSSLEVGTTTVTVSNDTNDGIAENTKSKQDTKDSTSADTTPNVQKLPTLKNTDSGAKSLSKSLMADDGNSKKCQQMNETIV